MCTNISTVLHRSRHLYSVCLWTSMASNNTRASFNYVRSFSPDWAYRTG